MGPQVLIDLLIVGFFVAIVLICVLLQKIIER